MNAVVEPQVSIAALEAGTIDAESFDHESHVYLGWLYVREFPLAEAIARFSQALQRLTTKLGVPGKYHDTVTWFYLLLIAERRAAADDDSWNSFRRNNEDLFSRDENILDRYYSSELLWSDRARQSFVLPNMPDRHAA